MQTAPLSRKMFMVWCALIAALMLANHARYVAKGSWGDAGGYEYKDIALSLAAGQGYSFPGTRRWLFQDQADRDDIPDYGPTAWKEPLYTGWMAVWYGMLGEKAGGFVLTIWQSLCWAGACALLAWLGARLFSLPVGMTAATLLAALPQAAYAAVGSVQVASAAGVLLLLMLHALLTVVDRPTRWRCVGLGVLLGLSALTLAGLLLFSLVIAAAFLNRAWRERSLNLVGHLAVIALVSAATISPWTIRNYQTFGHFIPIQTGLGNFAFYANPMLVQTYREDFKVPPYDTPVPWTSSGPWDAVNKLTSSSERVAFMSRSIEALANDPPPDWESLNEYERDRLYLGMFRSFVAEHPGEFLKLVASKFGVMFVVPHLLLPITALAMIGFGFVIRQRHGWMIPASALALTIPYLIVAPLYYRYRYPIEPMLVLMAALPLVWMTQRIGSRLRAKAEL